MSAFPSLDGIHPEISSVNPYVVRTSPHFLSKLKAAGKLLNANELFAALDVELTELGMKTGTVPQIVEIPTVVGTVVIVYSPEIYSLIRSDSSTYGPPTIATKGLTALFGGPGILNDFADDIGHKEVRKIVLASNAIDHRALTRQITNLLIGLPIQGNFDFAERLKGVRVENQYDVMLGGRNEALSIEEFGEITEITEAAFDNLATYYYIPVGFIQNLIAKYVVHSPRYTELLSKLLQNIDKLPDTALIKKIYTTLHNLVGTVIDPETGVRFTQEMMEERFRGDVAHVIYASQETTTGLVNAVMHHVGQMSDSQRQKLQEECLRLWHIMRTEPTNFEKEVRQSKLFIEIIGHNLFNSLPTTQTAHATSQDVSWDVQGYSYGVPANTAILLPIKQISLNSINPTELNNLEDLKLTPAFGANSVINGIYGYEYSESREYCPGAHQALVITAMYLLFMGANFKVKTSTPEIVSASTQTIRHLPMQVSWWNDAPLRQER